MLLAKLIYPSGVRFEIEKFDWLGSLNSETAVTLAWHTAPHKTTQDLFDQELIVGGITGVDPDTPRLYNSLIGTRFKIVNGYNSTAHFALAIERGEVQGIADWSWSSSRRCGRTGSATSRSPADAGRAGTSRSSATCRTRSTSSRMTPTAR